MIEPTEKLSEFHSTACENERGLAHLRSLPDARLDGDSEHGSQGHLTPVVPVIHSREPE
jgi:hypothetical protein